MCNVEYRGVGGQAALHASLLAVSGLGGRFCRIYTRTLGSEATVRAQPPPPGGAAMSARLGTLAASGLYRRRQHRQSLPPSTPR